MRFVHKLCIRYINPTNKLQYKGMFSTCLNSVQEGFSDAEGVRDGEIFYKSKAFSMP